MCSMLLRCPSSPKLPIFRKTQIRSQQNVFLSKMTFGLIGFFGNAIDLDSSKQSFERTLLENLHCLSS